MQRILASTTPILSPPTPRFKPAPELREVFAAAGADGRRPLVLTCGTGVTACVLRLALELSHPGTQVRTEQFFCVFQAVGSGLGVCTGSRRTEPH